MEAKNEYTTSLYIEVTGFIAFFRTLRENPNYELIEIKMCYSQCADGIYRHFGTLRVTIKFWEYPCSYGIRIFHFGRTFERELHSKI